MTYPIVLKISDSTCNMKAESVDKLLMSDILGIIQKGTFTHLSSTHENYYRITRKNSSPVNSNIMRREHLK